MSLAQQALGFSRSQSAKPFARSKAILSSKGGETATTGVVVRDAGEETRQKAGKAAWESIDNLAYNAVGLVGLSKAQTLGGQINYDRAVKNAMVRVEKDMQMLDEVVAGKSQLTGNEFVFLAACVASAGLSPLLFSEHIVEVLVPVAAAIPAAIGISSEYVGKISVSNGKEIASTTLQAAAEAEIFLASAERSKAVVPLCVGVAVVAGTGALFAPAFVEDFLVRFGAQIANEFFLAWPLIAVLSAAVAGLSYQETQNLCNRAIGTGTRRFAKSGDIGRTWLSATEQVTNNSDKLKDKISTFAIGTLPAPLLASLLPGSIEFKCVVCATSAAAQAAFYLAGSEYEIARALDAVALKTRAAAVAETYANQGARSGAILPFTSALGGVCAAGGAAVVELLPLVHNPILQAVASIGFPAAAAVFAAAASVSKARTEVNAAAAKAASEAFADAQFLSKSDDEKTSIGATSRGTTEPVRGVIELIRLAVNSFVSATRRKTREFFGRFSGNGGATPALA